MVRSLGSQGLLRAGQSDGLQLLEGVVGCLGVEVCHYLQKMAMLSQSRSPQLQP